MDTFLTILDDAVRFGKMLLLAKLPVGCVILLAIVGDVAYLIHVQRLRFVGKEG
jgi:hypothetical protein